MTATQLAFAGVVDTAPFSPDAPWQSLPMVSVDTETTGPDPATARIVEVAAHRFARGQKIERWSRPIDPGVEIPAEASAIHGWTNASLRECKAPKLSDLTGVECPETGECLTVAHALAERLAGAVVVFYNGLRFDGPVLERELSAVFGVPFKIGPHVDLLPFIWSFDRFVSGKGRHKLKTTAERWGASLGGEAHRAGYDAELVIRLLAKMRDRLPHTIGEVLTEQARLSRARDEDIARWKAREQEEARA